MVKETKMQYISFNLKQISFKKSSCFILTIVKVFLQIGPFTIVNMTEKIGLFKHYIMAWVGKNKEIKKENFSKNN